MRHEDLSLLMMKELNRVFNGKLQMALDIFTNQYPKKFLHQLISGQVDVDRMDYLTRDSFFTGVNEGVIGYDRIIKMLTVHQGELMVEEKGIYSIEKFLVARRLMYWQVYLHKTVLCAEQMLKRVIKRAKSINAQCNEPLFSFMNNHGQEINLNEFCKIDDVDVMMAIKQWCNHEDKVLSILCNGILNRSLIKIKYFGEPIQDKLINEKKKNVAQQFDLSDDDTEWLVFSGEASSSTYNFENEKIKILFKNGEVKDITEVDNALINDNIKGLVKKYYICYPKD